MGFSHRFGISFSVSKYVFMHSLMALSISLGMKRVFERKKVYTFDKR